MKKPRIAYYPETDSLVIDLRGKPAKDAAEVAENLIVSYDEDGNITAIDVEGGASRMFAPLIKALAARQPA